MYAVYTNSTFIKAKKKINKQNVYKFQEVVNPLKPSLKYDNSYPHLFSVISSTGYLI